MEENSPWNLRSPVVSHLFVSAGSFGQDQRKISSPTRKLGPRPNFHIFYPVAVVKGLGQDNELGRGGESAGGKGDETETVGEKLFYG
ncbi:hypothetical protein RUM43_001721 [Polyplax serrata]|uniref:Uncharacterized protein n=1 Tax=Polyplax serrata TaxID=468196 RepID=A0AAN8XQR9_POLSC